MKEEVVFTFIPETDESNIFYLYGLLSAGMLMYNGFRVD